MLFRLVRPMFRDGSVNAYFNQRIPADVRERAGSMTQTDQPPANPVRFKCRIAAFAHRSSMREPVVCVEVGHPSG